MPTRKVTAATLGGATATIIVWILGLISVDPPSTVAVAFGTICTFVAGWVTHDDE